MEIRVSLVFLGLLALLHSGLRAEAPQAVLSGGQGVRARLSELEDQAASAPADPGLLRRLSGEYLRLGRPELAVATLRAAGSGLMADPLLADRLARAYEATGNLSDAATTANLALARCLRAAGSSAASHLSQAPAGGCSELTLIHLERHRDALWHMMRWGVTDPRRDPRRQLAYRLAERRATIAAFR